MERRRAWPTTTHSRHAARPGWTAFDGVTLGMATMPSWSGIVSNGAGALDTSGESGTHRPRLTGTSPGVGVRGRPGHVRCYPLLQQAGEVCNNCGERLWGVGQLGRLMATLPELHPSPSPTAPFPLIYPPGQERREGLR